MKKVQLELKTIQENALRVQESVWEACIKAGREQNAVQLMAVSKTRPIEQILPAIQAGLRLFGENRVQELSQKAEFFAQHQAVCHLIGQLQTNKVKYLPALTDTIESVDSLHLGQEISRRYSQAGKQAKLLLEVNIGAEESKSGVAPEQTGELLAQVQQLPGIKVEGMMCVPPICEGDLVRRYFAAMRRLFDDLNSLLPAEKQMTTLSMGMSGDYLYAIQEGSTLVRVGQGIFGARDYSRPVG